MHLHLARHGQVWPAATGVENVDYPKGDPPLTDLGEAQAARLGDRLAQIGFAGVVYASPYQRTVHTAQIIAERVEAPVVLCRPMREIVKRAEAMREFRGQTPDELRARFPRVTADDDFPYPWWEHEAETDEDVEKRLASFVDELIEKREGDALLIGHGASVSAGAHHVLRRFAPERLDEMQPTWNCALVSFQVAPAFEVHRLACVEHLPEEAVTANSQTRAEALERMRQSAD